jgi:alkylated DNA repair dioxygenase AlkB
MVDLFQGAEISVPIRMPDAEVTYTRSIDLPTPANEMLRDFIDRTPWRAEQITVWGRTHDQPRLVAWYGDAGASYSYSKIKLDPLPWTPTLKVLRERIERFTDSTFNSVLLNLYRDEKDSMGMHSDDEPELGARPVIASLSIGETRTLTFKHKHHREMKPVKIPLESGSLLLMKGETQRNWLHGINKQTSPCGPRVNLTFRRIRSITFSGSAPKTSHH